MSAFIHKLVFLKFHAIEKSGTFPFLPYFGNPHNISFQKIYILSVHSSNHAKNFIALLLYFKSLFHFPTSKLYDVVLFFD